MKRARSRVPSEGASPRSPWLIAGLLAAALGGLSGCESTPSSADPNATPSGSEDEDTEGLPADRSSPMLERLKASNRRAASDDRLGDLAAMRRDLEQLDLEIASLEAAGKDSTALARQRADLAATIAAEERLLSAGGR